MPRGREPEGEIALSNAERQARHRARRLAEQPPAAFKRQRTPRQSRRKLWNGALAVTMTIQDECAAWLDALPESLRDSATAEALQEAIDLDLDGVAAVQPPLGYGRDRSRRLDVLAPAWRSRPAATNRGSLPCSPAGEGCAWLRSRRKRRICHGRARPPGRWRVGTKEPVSRSNQETFASKRNGLAVTITLRLRSIIKWCMRPTKTRTQKFGHFPRRRWSPQPPRRTRPCDSPGVPHRHR